MDTNPHRWGITRNLKFDKSPMKTKKLNQIKPLMICDTGFTSARHGSRKGRYLRTATRRKGQKSRQIRVNQGKSRLFFISDMRLTIYERLVRARLWRIRTIWCGWSRSGGTGCKPALRRRSGKSNESDRIQVNPTKKFMNNRGQGRRGRWLILPDFTLLSFGMVV